VNLPISAARLAGFRILLRVEQGSVYASELLHSEGVSTLGDKDQRLTTELVYGVLRQRQLLDWYLSRHCRMPLEKLDTEVLLALRLGAYQILFLTRIPERAAINESVELVKAFKLKSAAGFTNAVLRRIKKNEFENTLRSLSLDSISNLSIRYSHPEWLVQRWIERCGRDLSVRLLEQNDQPPRTFFRMNTLGLSVPSLLESLARQGVSVRTHPFSGDIWEVVEGNIYKTALMLQGKIFVQDPASQLIPRLLDTRAEDFCLDLCAAPGGKSSQIAQLTQGRARIIATDLSWRRLRTANQLHGGQWKNVHFLAMDATQPLPFAVQFDRILVDAPCSGTGTLQRNPDIRWRVHFSDLGKLQRLQIDLLENAVQYLRPGGALVYSTCSLEDEENEAVISRFLSDRGDYFLDLPGDPYLQGFFNDKRFFKLLPSEWNCDGFFAAILRKRESC
jgi:16S rRNA (cytosine967-C5)-methyltransferase